MKQLIQDLRTGKTLSENLPVPRVKPGHLLIKTHRSLVSAGTEKMLVDFGKASFLQKARQQPDKVRQVLDKVKTDGLQPTVETVFRKLNEPLPLGYCNAGEVIAIGKGVNYFRVGDRVISNGNHAEVVCVPKNLVARIPKDVSYDEATFTVIGAIALQGMRLVKPEFGETVVVIGLGLIGLITTQLLLANGCEVIGFDFDENKVNLARAQGVIAYQVDENFDTVETVNKLTEGIGTDAVIITASTKSNDVIAQAARMSRKRARIVLVGVVGLNIQRSDFYEKELTFQVSCSYGPGRYDENYEQKGNDYPLAFVRWTQNRNFQAILKAIATKRIDVQSLISEVIDLQDYQEIYADMGHSGAIASLLKFPASVDLEDTTVKIIERTFTGQKGIIGIIGAGNFTKAVVAPTLKKLKAEVKYIASAGGLTGTLTAKKFGIANSTTDYRTILEDEDVDAVIITTRHDAHAALTVEALDAGKHVFVEKPLALNYQELEAVEAALKRNNQSLTVGFNRRFSPFIQDAKKQLATDSSPINVIATMNAGFIPTDSWVHDPEIGGGRIIGEACHLIDLISFLTGSIVEKVVMNAHGAAPSAHTDNASISLKYKNGSVGTINYFSNGSKAYSKERVEVYSQNRTMVIDNFRKSKYYGFKSSGMSRRQDKGHYTQFEKFLKNIKEGGEAIIPVSDIMNTSRAALAAVKSLQTGTWVQVKS
jgi:predicted dehydrogenase/threonine dehydrogenase-like Zn-dependent dehydrogenase